MKRVLLLSFILASVMIGCKKDDDTSGTAKIGSIKLTAWPANDSNGIPWDSTSAPDIYFELLNADFSESANHPFDDSTFMDATTGPLLREIYTPYRLASPESDYYIELLDKDTTDSDDSMGKIKFNLENYTNRPSSITIGDNTVGIVVELGLIWE